MIRSACRRARDGRCFRSCARAQASREKRRVVAAAERRDSRRLAVHRRRRTTSCAIEACSSSPDGSLAVDRAITPSEMAGARVIDLRDDQYVLPGFFDVHAHYNMTLGAGGVRSDEYTYNPLIFLANGVTSTFPAGEYDPEGMMAARQRIDAGEQIGPRIYNSGPYFGTARRGWNQNATAADIYRDVDEWAAKGARAFKAKGIAPQHLRPLIERAHLHGLTVTAHLESGFRNSTNARDAILMGIDRVEHILGGDQLDSTKTGVSALVDGRHVVEAVQGHRPAVRLAPRDVRSDDHRAGLLLAAAGGIRLLDRRAEVLHARSAGVGEDEAGASRGGVVGLALLGDASNHQGALRRRRHTHPRHGQSEHRRVHRGLLGASRAAHARADRHSAGRGAQDRDDQRRARAWRVGQARDDRGRQAGRSVRRRAATRSPTSRTRGTSSSCSSRASSTIPRTCSRRRKARSDRRRGAIRSR